MMTTAHPDPRFAIGGPEATFAGCHKPLGSFRIPAVRASRSIFNGWVTGGGLCCRSDQQDNIADQM